VVDTLVGVLIGGSLAIVGQITIELVRRRSARRSSHREAVNAARVRQWLFYNTQRVIGDAIESGTWWPEERSSLDLPAAREVRQLTELLPPDVWVLYTAAASRISQCVRLRRQPGQDPLCIDRPSLHQLVGAFVTVDTARRALDPITSTLSSDVDLDGSALAPEDVERGLVAHAAVGIDVDKWRRLLVR
jgi:hypothetical protein